MTVEEIFTKTINHILQGIMIHDEFANYYEFLGLEGYAKCHEYHGMLETKAYRKLMTYYITHYNKFIPEPKPTPAEIIPTSWAGYTRQDVDTKTRQSAVKLGLEKWVAHETQTKTLYQQMYKELIALGEIAAANYFNCLIKDVDEELASVVKYHLYKQSMGYDMSEIIAEQKHKYKHYKEKFCKCLDE